MQVFLCVSAIVACLDFFGNPLLTSHHSHSLLNFTCYIFFNFMSQSLLLEATLPWGSSHSGWCLCLCFGLCCWCNGVHGECYLFFCLVLGMLCYLLVSLSPCMPVAIFWNLFLVITMKRWHGPHLSCLMPFLWSNCFYAYIFSPSISRFSLWIFGSENSRTFDLTSELPGQTTRLVG